MKRTTLSSFSAWDMRQTASNGDARPSDVARKTKVSVSAGDKSRARSHRSFSPTSSDFSSAQLSSIAPKADHHIGAESERQLNRVVLESLESEPSVHRDHHSCLHQQTASQDDNGLSGCPSSQKRKTNQQKQKQQEDSDMSQTIQSIQSLSIQLNRAASLSASLDDGDAISVSRDTSASRAADSYVHELSGGKKLTKLVGKKATRMKEILLQNLGKAYKTTDDLFEMYEENFYKQQAQAAKIHKEFKSYVSSLKVAQDAGKNLNICIQHSTGVYQSARHDLVCENLSQLDILNEDLLEKLRGQIQVSLSEYMSQFSELRDKIQKRKRKLIDYDSSRRVYEIMLAQMQRKRQPSNRQQAEEQQYQGLRSLRPSFIMRSSSASPPVAPTGSGDSVQSTASQLVDEARLLKLREQYNYCKIMFETINSELYQELPMVYEKKMKHLLMTLQNYFSLEAQFHSNAGKLFATAGDVIDELPMAIHRSQKQGPSIKPIDDNNKEHNNDDEYINHKAGGSSGVGSSRGDSSLDSSSSPDNSVNGSASPTDTVCCVSALSHSEAHEASNQLTSEMRAEAQLDVGASDGLQRELASSSRPSIMAGLSSSSAQLDSLSVDLGGSSASDSIATDDLEALKQTPGEKLGDDQQASTSGTSSCSVIEVKPKTGEPAGGKGSAGFLYKVKTSYKYLAEDVDELCFEADEIIQVVEFDENQEQEEGWLMGLREVNGQKGLFPANFTKPVS